jgi:NADPH-dependent 2,4-dienoyl-CoA reductase/sulfur reductase-like enzyme
MHRESGLAFEVGSAITAAHGNGRIEELELAGGRRIECGTVLMGVGIRPAADWLAGSGLETDGVRTDPVGQTKLPGVFAAGDVARPFDPRFGVHARTEHWEAAAKGGAAAARAMLGEPAGRSQLPSFWSDQHGVRIQYAGNAEHADEVEVRPAEGDRDLLAVYRRGGAPVAVLGVDRPRDVLALRREIELAHAGAERPHQPISEGVAA